MPIRNIFKKKQPEKEPEEKKKESLKKKPAAEGQKKEAKPKQRTLATERSYQILKGPHVTEKATDLVKKNQYIFKIFKNANKGEIKKTVESIYKVNVASIKIINVPKKKRRLGRIEGVRPGYKKAIVRIKKGQKIDVLPR